MSGRMQSRFRNSDVSECMTSARENREAATNQDILQGFPWLILGCDVAGGEEIDGWQLFSSAGTNYSVVDRFK